MKTCSTHYMAQFGTILLRKKGYDYFFYKSRQTLCKLPILKKAGWPQSWQWSWQETCPQKSVLLDTLVKEHSRIPNQRQNTAICMSCIRPLSWIDPTFGNYSNFWYKIWIGPIFEKVAQTIFTFLCDPFISIAMLSKFTIAQ